MTLYDFDQAYQNDGVTLLCGVDEAGRGPLAGPVYAAAVILPDGIIEGLNDSKKLSETRRNALYDVIIANSIYSVASASHEEIDALNILQATMLAMQRAVDGLAVPPELVLVDGNFAPPLPCPAIAVIKGDAISACIAAASILAKTARDRHMTELDVEYPGYGFAAHKGYPTKAHYAALDKLGASPVHRNSFLRKWKAGR